MMKMVGNSKRTILISLLPMIAFLGCITGNASAAPRDRHLNLKGFNIQITSAHSGAAAKSNWKRQTGGADVIEVRETTADGEALHLFSLTACKGSVTHYVPCYRIKIKEQTARRRSGFLRGGRVHALYASIDNINEAYDYFARLCGSSVSSNAENGGECDPDSPQHDFMLSLESTDETDDSGGIIVLLEIHLLSTFMTFFDAGDYSPDSEANLATLKVNVGRVEFK